MSRRFGFESDDQFPGSSSGEVDDSARHEFKTIIELPPIEKKMFYEIDMDLIHKNLSEEKREHCEDLARELQAALSKDDVVEVRSLRDKLNISISVWIDAIQAEKREEEIKHGLHMLPLPKNRFGKK